MVEQDELNVELRNLFPPHERSPTDVRKLSFSCCILLVK